jgi:formylglycine-generating enzyme required for sulfatase activity
MAGNVAEWVADWYGDSYFSDSPRENPTGPESGSSRVVKSIPWSWNLDLDLIAQSANRWNFIPDATGKEYSGSTGFRCVLADN